MQKNRLTFGENPIFSPAIPRMYTRRWQFLMGTALFVGAWRVSFFIDVDSTVRHVVDHHNTDVHVREMKAAFARLAP